MLSGRKDRPEGDSSINEHMNDLSHYKKGDVVEVEEEAVDNTQENVKSRNMGQGAGAAAGAVLVGGALAAMGGLPLALAGAAVGAVTGSIAGKAVAKEWVRGEDISSAMEFDQKSEAGPADSTERAASHIVSIGRTATADQAADAAKAGKHHHSHKGAGHDDHSL